MADVKKMATREGYGRGLVALGAEHEDVVVLDADLAGSTKTGMFAKAYPDRHINCGIAEADMMCVAAGFAASGFVPRPPLPCSPRGGLSSRSAIPSAIPT